MKTGSAYHRRRAGERLIREAYDLNELMPRLLAYGIDENLVAGIRTASNTLHRIGGRIMDAAEQEERK